MFDKLSATAIVVGLSVAAGAHAEHGPRSQIVFAPVLDVQPLVRQVTVTRPREECWLETAVVPRRGPAGRAAPVIAGGLIGGVIGHQFGHGRNNDAMTLLGTLVGSAIASDAAAKRGVYAGGREVTRERCEVVTEAYDEERVEGYRVTYEYMGRRYATVMPEPPASDRIRLHVTVEAAGY